jgi:hypothetical protein
LSALYTVGCSHTKYVWPTYADILGKSYDKHYNWGIPGIGNFAIMNRVIAIVDCMHPLDELIIQWTYPNRFDYHREVKGPDGIRVGWYRGGNLAHDHDQVQQAINRHAFCEESYLMLSENYIQLTKAYLAQHNIKYKMLGSDFEVGKLPSLSIAQDFKIPFKKFLNVRPESNTFQKETDQHYTPAHHLEYLRQGSFKITKEMEQYVQQAEDVLDTLHDWKWIQFKLEEAGLTDRVHHGR